MKIKSNKITDDLDDIPDDIPDDFEEEIDEDYIDDEEIDEDEEENGEEELEEQLEVDYDDENTDKITDNKLLAAIIDPHKENNMANILLNENEFYDNLSDEKNETTLYLTKYEKIRAIGTRAEMISKGAKTTLDLKKLELNIEDLSPIDLAILELKHKMMPFIIRRNLPNGSVVNISINKLHDTNINIH